MSEPNEKTPINRPESTLPEAPHVVIRNRLREPILEMFPVTQQPQAFVQSVLDVWGKDDFFQGKEHDLESVKQSLADGMEAATKLLTVKPHITNLLQEHGIPADDFMKTCATSYLVYLSERAMLKHLVYGGAFPESKTNSVPIKNSSITTDALAAEILDFTSELHTQPGVSYITDSEEGERIAQSLVTIFQLSGQQDNLKKNRYLFTSKVSLGFGSTDRHNRLIIIGLATKPNLPADWATKLTTAFIVSSHELTHAGQDHNLLNLLAEIDAYTGQAILSDEACRHVQDEKITEKDLGMPGEEFIEELKFQVEIRQEGQLGELFRSLAKQDTLEKLKADHNIIRVEAQVDNAILNEQLPSAIDWL